MKRKDMDSEGISLLRFLWRHGGAKMGHSWKRINQKMSQGLQLAIESGLEFEPDDMKIIMGGRRNASEDGFRGGYWTGENLERWYRLACAEGEYRSPSPTAIAMLEKYLKREPFILATRRNERGERLVVGSRFEWAVGKGKKRARMCLTVTSFADDQQSLVACSYKNEERGNRLKIAKRVRITLEALREHNKAVRAALKEEKKTNG